ncbi:MAG: hypothetical protein F4X72_12755 [Dehalococcoidia bacterium]|nr:hypothetical protein [Dehalococcoidia bacterium]
MFEVLKVSEDFFQELQVVSGRGGRLWVVVTLVVAAVGVARGVVAADRAVFFGELSADEHHQE